MADPHAISIKDAAELTLRWRHNQPAGGINAGQFERIAFDNLLAQPGCQGIRIYFGRHAEIDPLSGSDWTLVMIGTDGEGNDIINPAGTEMRLEAGGGGEQQPRSCPPVCSDPNPLNTPP